MAKRKCRSGQCKQRVSLTKNYEKRTILQCRGYLYEKRRRCNRQLNSKLYCGPHLPNYVDNTCTKCITYNNYNICEKCWDTLKDLSCY